MMQSVIPFSWFIAQHFLDYSIDEHLSPNHSKMLSNSEGARIVNGILEGNTECIEKLINGIRGKQKDEFPDSFPVLPSHVLDIKVTVGPNLNENDILQFE